MDPVVIGGLVAGLVFTAILFPITRSRGRAPWWALLGLAGLIGFGIAMLVLFLGKPGRSRGGLGDIQRMYARGEIGEEEYRRAMTGIDRAA